MIDHNKSRKFFNPLADYHVLQQGSKRMIKSTAFFLFFLSNSLLFLSCPEKNRISIKPSLHQNIVNHFLQAKPVWIKGRETEKNLTLGFRKYFNKPQADEVFVKIAASTIYRAFLNGQFLGCGPARAGHGFYRVDEWQIGKKLKNGINVLAVEVAGYNANSYYLLDQPSFLQAEVIGNGQVLCATGDNDNGFEASIISERVQKVPRFSFQRPFIESYRLAPDAYSWRSDVSASLKSVSCSEVLPKKLLPRRVKYADFKTRNPLKIFSLGKFRTGKKVEKYWNDRSLTQIGKKLGGYPEQELEMNPSLTLQETEIVNQKIIDSLYQKSAALHFAALSFSIFDFGVNLSGFIGAKITCQKKTKLYFAFDEILTGNDVDFKRLGCINIVSYEMEPGSYEVESMEPYTLRYLKILSFEGDCSIENIYLREYANSDLEKASFLCSDEKLNKIYDAGRQTFRQNAIDIFMDCPSRERAGWLCDSYFTARVAMALSGNTLIERNFFENFMLPDSFKNLPHGILPMCYPADHNDGVFIPNWAMWFVLQLEEYFNRSGDWQMVEALKPKILKLVAYLAGFKNEEGLLEKLPSWVFVEWSEANQFVQDVNYPTNMLFSGALAAAGRLYDLPQFIDESERMRHTIWQQSFNGKFFVDNAKRNSEGELEITNNSSEVCQYYAFFFGIASPQTQPELWQTLLTEFGPARKENNRYPNVFMANSFIGNYLRLELLSRYGKTAQLIQESRDYFYYMAERTGTLWENNGAYASCNHGFACHVVQVLYRDVLGIYQIDYQKKRITLRFSDLNLLNCRGQMPIGDDEMRFSWQRDDKMIYYQIDVPPGYHVAVENLSQLELVNQSIAAEEFVKADKAGRVHFWGAETAELFSREIEKSLAGVLKKNYQTKNEPFMPGYITASVDNRPWHDTMWSRDGGTFLRELVMWGYSRHACLLCDCLIQLVEKNDENYYTFPEYFKYLEPASGKELDGTASMIIGMTLLWERLAQGNPYKTLIYQFLHQPSSPLLYLHEKLKTQPLLDGSGEFGGGCGIDGDWCNVVQNNLLRLAFLAAAKMETQAGDYQQAQLYQLDAEKISQNMLSYLVSEDGSWLWCINPKTLTPDSAVIFHPINKGFGGLNGVASMLADVSGLEPQTSPWPGVTVCNKTFEQLFAFPLRKEQFEKFGLWSQFDEFREGMSSGPSYGDGYALQTMLLFDKMEMADKSITWLAKATFQPLAEYKELDRDSPYYFYERYYSPDIVGRMKLEQGCGALNLVNVTEPLKAGRLILGVDDYSSEHVKIIPRVPPSWTGYEAINWPIRTAKGIVHANLRYEKKNGKIKFNLTVKQGQPIPQVAIRFVTAKGFVWEKYQDVTKLEIDKSF